MKPLAHSVSSIKTYRQCPGKYKLQRIDKALPYVESAATIRGNVAHASIESHIEHGTEMTDTAVPNSKKVAKRIAKLRETGELLMEQEITINKKGELVGWFDKDAWFRFKVDLIWRRFDGRVSRIIDWKTGKSAYLDEFQLEGYCIAESFHNPEFEMVRADYMFLDEDADVKGKVIMDRETIEIRKQELFEECFSIEEAAKRGDMPFKKNRFCDWCDAKKLGKCGL